MDQLAILLPQCWGTGEQKAIKHFCAVTVGLSGLSAVALTLSFGAGASPVLTEREGMQSHPMWNWYPCICFCVMTQ